MHSGVVIEKARKTLGLTQKQLATLADVDHTTISRIERGVTNAPARTIKQITDALGVAISSQGDAA